MKVRLLNLTIFNLWMIWIIGLSNGLNAQTIDKPKVGLVLSGGGARGFAHIGVLKVLEKENIKIDYIAGTSIGSIIGGLYSLGYTADQLEEIVKSQDWDKLLSDYVSREYNYLTEKSEQDRYLISFIIEKEKGIKLPSGLVQGQNVVNLLCELTSKYHNVTDFNKLPIPFACVAADLETGKEIVLNGGYLPESIFASMAIPVFFAPVKLNNRLVIDGGIANNLPSDIVKNMGADIIIGVDIQSKPLDKNEIDQLTDVIGQLTTMMGGEKYEKNKKLCDVIIEPDIKNYSITDFYKEAVDTLILKGKQAAKLKIDDIKKLFINNDDSEYQKIKLETDSTFEITSYQVAGLEETTGKYIIDKSGFEFPSLYNFQK